jgi:hypothetical protein
MMEKLKTAREHSSGKQNRPAANRDVSAPKNDTSASCETQVVGYFIGQHVDTAENCPKKLRPGNTLRLAGLLLLSKAASKHDLLTKWAIY